MGATTILKATIKRLSRLLKYLPQNPFHLPSCLEVEHYVRILEKKLDEMESLYPDHFIFQQDNAPPHRAAKAFKQANFSDNLSWPAYSSYLSPIENIWAWLKGRVNKELLKTIQKLKKVIERNWYSITPKFLRPYIDSMLTHMAMCIEREEGWLF